MNRLQWSSVACLPVVQAISGSKWHYRQLPCFHENNCNMQPLAWAEHLLQCQCQLSLPPSEGR